MSFYEKLVASTTPQRQALYQIPFVKAGVEGNVTHAQYVAFLTEAYHHVKHTVPLLMACGGRLSESRGWMRQAVAEYIEEELGHEEWILNDIRQCGHDAEQVRHGQPSLATELMLAYAYDMIVRRNPMGFFGMVYVLEGTSVALATQAAEAVQRKLDLPNQAFSYLRSHGSLDLEHVDFFRNLMGRVTDPSDQQDILHGAKVFFRLYGDIFRGLLSTEERNTAYATA